MTVRRKESGEEREEACCICETPCLAVYPVCRRMRRCLDGERNLSHTLDKSWGAAERESPHYGDLGNVEVNPASILRSKEI